MVISRQWIRMSIVTDSRSTNGMIKHSHRVSGIKNALILWDKGNNNFLFTGSYGTG